MVNFIGCNHSYEYYTSLIVPTANPNFENAQYDAAFWNRFDRSAYTIYFYYDGDAYDFSKYYFPQTMVITSYNGFQIGSAQFVLWDYHPNHFNLPFFPVANMMVLIGNKNQTEWYGRFRVQDIEPIHFSRRTDGTENRRFKVTCLDLKTDLKRWLVRERYVEATTYAIIKDLVVRHTTLDGSDIDETKGFTLKDYEVNYRYPADAIQELLDLEVSANFKLDPYTMKATVHDVTEPEINFLTISDQDPSSPNYIYNYFLPNDFFVFPQYMTTRNRVLFWFNGKYSTGLVNVTNGGDHIIGVGTKFRTSLKKDSKVELDGDDTLYTVTNINSDADITVSPVVARSTVSGITFSATGFRDFVIVDDSENIATMALILDEEFDRAGVFEVKMPERSGSMTKDQAIVLAQAYVYRMTRALVVRGQAKSKNYKINTKNLQGGWTMTLDLEQTRQINGVITLQALTLQDRTGGMINRIIDPTKWYWDSERIDPIHDMTMDFTDRRLLDELMTERTLQDIREVRITDDDIILLAISAKETMYINDCFGIVPPVGLNGTDQPIEEIELGDDFIEVSIDNDILFYMSPADPGDQEGYIFANSTTYAIMA